MKKLIYSNAIKIAFYQLTIITLIVISHILIQSYNKKEIADDVIYNAVSLNIIGKFINFGLLVISISAIAINFFSPGELKKKWKIITITPILSAIVYVTLLMITFKLVN